MAEGYEIALWCLLVLASITDLLWGKIFNAITFPFIVVGLGLHFAFGGWHAGEQSALAVCLALVLFFPLYLMRVMAAADVKLLMAIGAWSEPALVLRLAVCSVIVGAAVGGIVLLRSMGTQESVRNVIGHLHAKAKVASHRMPFAPAFLCGYFLLKIAEFYR